jgi:hypothetical protein
MHVYVCMYIFLIQMYYMFKSKSKYFFNFLFIEKIKIYKIKSKFKL